LEKIQIIRKNVTAPEYGLPTTVVPFVNVFILTPSQELRISPLKIQSRLLLLKVYNKPVDFCAGERILRGKYAIHFSS
jgi:hypothetical protein